MWRGFSAFEPFVATNSCSDSDGTGEETKAHKLVAFIQVTLLSIFSNQSGVEDMPVTAALSTLMDKSRNLVDTTHKA